MPSQTNEKVVTRFAPSPTGLLHIGNARAALFNFLYARQNKGKFVLRIEDTDKARSKPEFEKDIIDSLKWLGLTWDVQFKQSERLSIYKKYLDDLLSSGSAYEHGGAIYFNIKSQIENLKFIEFNDLVRGKISTPVDAIDDFVIVKSDGMPLFAFTNVIDDFEMGITHVIRGEDHISNTPRQILLTQSLGISSPQYAHIPIVLSPDRAKMSKRHGAVAVSEFREQGYLPEAMINSMALLGWNPGTDKEHFSLPELAETFSLDRVQKGGAIFNIEKLNNLNSHYIRGRSDGGLLEELKHFSKRLQKVDRETALRIVSICKQRITRLSEFESLSWYLFDKPPVDAKMLVFKKSTPKNTKKGLELIINAFSIINSNEWTQPKLQAQLENVVKQNNVGNGDVFWPARVALSGQEQSSSPVELAWALEKQETIDRLKKASSLL